MTTNGHSSRKAAGARTPVVAIVGAGMSGLCMGIALKRAGIRSFTIYEKADEVGGTWRDNTYPGLSCDVPSRFYQYTFAPNPDWSHYFSPGGEIQRYFSSVAESHGLREHIAFRKEVVSARFDHGRWELTTQDGEAAQADFLVTACGVLHHPRYPDIDGLDSFEGATFHSSRWDHDVELRGRRVGIVGTGSTGVQIVSALAGVAGGLALFQRTPQWVFPLPNKRYSPATRGLLRRFPRLNRVAYRTWQVGMEKTLLQAVVQPGWQRSLVSWLCRQHLRLVRDPELRRKLTPDYEPMCKRLIVSSTFYRAIQRPGVELVTERIERVEPAGVVTSDGTLHELDVLVLATGFDAHAYVRPMQVVGEGGHTLDEAWRERIRAYRTVAMPGFPNFFMLMGPHSPIGNSSLVPIAEAQVRYVMRWIDMWRAGVFAAAAPTEESTERFNEEMHEAMPGTIWVSGCQSWYLGPDGMPELWPWTPGKHRDMLREPAIQEFEVRRDPSAATPAGGAASAASG